MQTGQWTDACRLPLLGISGRQDCSTPKLPRHGPHRSQQGWLRHLIATAKKPPDDRLPCDHRASALTQLLMPGSLYRPRPEPVKRNRHPAWPQAGIGQVFRPEVDRTRRRGLSSRGHGTTSPTTNAHPTEKQRNWKIQGPVARSGLMITSQITCQNSRSYSWSGAFGLLDAHCSAYPSCSTLIPVPFKFMDTTKSCPRFPNPYFNTSRPSFVSIECQY